MSTTTDTTRREVTAWDLHRYYGFPVVTRQEKELYLNPLLGRRMTGSEGFEAVHGSPTPAGQEDWTWFFSASGPAPEGKRPAPRVARAEALQLDLFPDGGSES